MVHKIQSIVSKENERRHRRTPIACATAALYSFQTVSRSANHYWYGSSFGQPWTYVYSMYAFISFAGYFQEKEKNHKLWRWTSSHRIMVHICYGALRLAAHAVYFQTKFGAAPFLEMQFILSKAQGHNSFFFFFLVSCSKWVLFSPGACLSKYPVKRIFSRLWNNHQLCNSHWSMRNTLNILRFL